MKYLYDLPVPALEALNRAAWVQVLGRPKNPEDVTEFLCHMQVSEDGTAGELHIRPEHEQFFGPGDRARMSNNRTIPDLPTP